jgi:hypothetical protein
VMLGATEHGVAPIHRYTEEEAREAGLLGEFGDLVEPPRERSRLLSAASQLVIGAGRTVGQAGSPSEQAGIPGDSGFSQQRVLTGASPVVGHRPDPMRMPSPSSGLVERLREMTVRR